MRNIVDSQKFQTELSAAMSHGSLQPLLQKIQNQAHWRIHLCPTSYEKSLSDQSQAWDLIKKSRVSLCHVYFPSDIKQKVAEREFIASEIDYTNLGVVECWFLFYSGQFLYLLETPETSKDYDNKLRKWAEQTLGINKSAPGFIHVTLLLERFAMIFLFVSNLCQNGLYDKEFEIEIELKGIKDFSLIDSFHNFMGNSSFFGEYFTRTNEISWNNSVQPKELLSKFEDLTLEAACHFLGSFGYKSLINKFREHLHKILSGISS